MPEEMLSLPNCLAILGKTSQCILLHFNFTFSFVGMLLPWKKKPDRSVRCLFSELCLSFNRHNASVQIHLEIHVLGGGHYFHRNVKARKYPRFLCVFSERAASKVPDRVMVICHPVRSASKQTRSDLSCCHFTTPSALIFSLPNSPPTLVSCGSLLSASWFPC